MWRDVSVGVEWAVLEGQA